MTPESDKIRFPPPSVPPAPPGAGPFPGRPNGDDFVPDLYLTLVEGLDALAMIGAVLKTLTECPDLPELDPEFTPLIVTARKSLQDRLGKARILSLSGHRLWSDEVRSRLASLAASLENENLFLDADAYQVRVFDIYSALIVSIAREVR